MVSEELCEDLELSQHLLLHNLNMGLRFRQHLDLFQQELSQPCRRLSFELLQFWLQLLHGLTVRRYRRILQVVSQLGTSYLASAEELGCAPRTLRLSVPGIWRRSVTYRGLQTQRMSAASSAASSGLSGRYSF